MMDIIVIEKTNIRKSSYILNIKNKQVKQRSNCFFHPLAPFTHRHIAKGIQPVSRSKIFSTQNTFTKKETGSTFV